MIQRRVFITDDSHLYIEVLSGVLEGDEMVVASTTDPREALERIIEFEPHVIIVDLVMPNKCGIELAKDIKNNSKLKHIPVLLISGNDLELEEALKSNEAINDYIRKIDKADDIRRAVRLYADVGIIQQIVKDLGS
jgi:CheY-like chemotaxis protein